MLKKIIIVILIIVGYKFIFNSENIIEKCVDHNYLKKLNDRNSLRSWDIGGVPKPMNVEKAKEAKILPNYQNIYFSDPTYKVESENTEFLSKNHDRIYEFLEQKYEKKMEVNNNYKILSKWCEYESNYNPKTFKKTWINAFSFYELKEEIKKQAKIYKKEMEEKQNLVKKLNEKIKAIRKNSNNQKIALKLYNDYKKLAKKNNLKIYRSHRALEYLGIAKYFNWKKNN